MFSVARHSFWALLSPSLHREKWSEFLCSYVPVFLLSISTLTSVLQNDCLNNIVNAERRGKRQVIIRPSSKVVVKFLSVMQRHGEYFLGLPPSSEYNYGWRDFYTSFVLSLRYIRSVFHTKTASVHSPWACAHSGDNIPFFHTLRLFYLCCCFQVTLASLKSSMTTDLEKLLYNSMVDWISVV